MKANLEFVSNWYGKAEIGNDLPMWIAGSKGLVSVVSEQPISNITVTFSSATNAFGSVRMGSTNRRNYVIEIGRLFLDESMIARFASNIHEKRLLVLGCSNGTVIHESAHIKAGSLEAYRDSTFKSNVHLVKCFNIVEDIFIESMIRNEFPVLAQFVAMKNAFLFEKAVEEARSGSGDVTIAGLAVIAKYLTSTNFDELVLDIIEDGHVAERLIAIVNDARKHYLSLEDRKDIAKRLLALITNEGESMGSEKSSPEASMNGMMIDDPELVIGSDLIAAIVAIEGGEDSEDTDLEAVAASVTALSRMDSVEFDEGIPILARQAGSETQNLIGFTEGVSGLHHHLRCITTPKTTPGAPKRRGKLVQTRISRIATDCKIFSDRYETQVSSSPEIRILVDGSGSMGKEFFSQCLSAAITIKRDLDSVGIMCSVVAHTADREISGLPKEVNIVEVAVPQRMNQTLLRARATWTALNPESKMLYENRDGNAIRYAARGFVSRNSKVLIVLSDGQPAARDYHHMAALAHTKGVINDVRKSGISVVAVSLKPEVVKSNEQLYGKKAHVEAFSSTNVAKAIATIVISQIEGN